MCIKKNLNNAQLQKDHFGQKMTLDNTQQDIFEILSKLKKIATYNIRLSTTFGLTILFSDDFFAD